VVEPSAAVPLATILSGHVDLAGKRVGIILSGGNADLDALPWRQK
jgi:threonine dehydratase